MVAMVSLQAAIPSVPAISGDYLEVRSCDVYTGPCFANSEMGLTGKDGIMVWSIRDGNWKGTALDGLSVIAVVRTDGTLGDLHYQPRSLSGAHRGRQGELRTAGCLDRPGVLARRQADQGSGRRLKRPRWKCAGHLREGRLRFGEGGQLGGDLDALSWWQGPSVWK